MLYFLSRFSTVDNQTISSLTTRKQSCCCQAAYIFFRFTKTIFITSFYHREHLPLLAPVFIFFFFSWFDFEQTVNLSTTFNRLINNKLQIWGNISNSSAHTIQHCRHMFVRTQRARQRCGNIENLDNYFVCSAVNSDMQETCTLPKKYIERQLNFFPHARESDFILL